jgi:hypothetical protein
LKSSYPFMFRESQAKASSRKLAVSLYENIPELKLFEDSLSLGLTFGISKSIEKLETIDSHPFVFTS